MKNYRTVDVGATTQGTSNRTRRRDRRGISKGTCFRILKFCLWVVVGVVCVLNVMPYAGMMRWVLQGLAESPLIANMLSVPIVGPLLSGFSLYGPFLSFLLGVVLWLIFQISELFWWFLMNQKPAVRAMLQQLSEEDYLEIADDEDPFIAKLKEQYNNIPQDRIKMVRLWSAIAYVADFVCCILYYPPLNGSVDTWLRAGMLADIDWINLLLALVTLFGVEIAIKLIQAINGIVQGWRVAR